MTSKKARIATMLATTGGLLAGGVVAVAVAQNLTVKGTTTGEIGSYFATVSGNMGIGTTAPTQKLDVAGNIRAQYLEVEQSGLSNYGSKLELQDTDTQDFWQINNRGGSDPTNRNKLMFWYSANNGAAWSNWLNFTGAGNIESSKWKATQLFSSQPGALPKTTGTFATGGGTLIITASGSGWQGGAAQLGFSIALDGVVKGYAKGFTNEGSSHICIAETQIVVTGVVAGNHTITLAAWNGMATDANDYFNVSVEELPF